MFLHHREGCIHHCFTVERIENRFYKYNINTTLNKPIYLFCADIEKLIVGHITSSRIAHIRAHGARLVSRSHIASHEAWLFGRRISVCFYTCQSCSLVCHLTRIIFQMIISLRDTLRRESIGSDDVCSSLQISSINIRYNIRACEIKHIVVALHLPRHISIPFPTKVLFCEVVSLYLRAHSPVEYQHSAVT